VQAQPVNTYSGNFWHTLNELSIPGRGIPLSFSQTYNSGAAQTAASSGPLGYGWTDNYNMSLAIGTGRTPVTLTEEDGATATFTLVDSSYTAPPRVLETLAYNSGPATYTLTRPDGDTYTFNSSGQLTAETDPNGSTTTLATPAASSPRSPTRLAGPWCSPGPVGASPASPTTT